MWASAAVGYISSSDLTVFRWDSKIGDEVGLTLELSEVQNKLFLGKA